MFHLKKSFPVTKQVWNGEPLKDSEQENDPLFIARRIDRSCLRVLPAFMQIPETPNRFFFLDCYTLLSLCVLPGVLSPPPQSSGVT